MYCIVGMFAMHSYIKQMQENDLCINDTMHLNPHAAFVCKLYFWNVLALTMYSSYIILAGSHEMYRRP